MFKALKKFFSQYKNNKSLTVSSISLEDTEYLFDFRNYNSNWNGVNFQQILDPLKLMLNLNQIQILMTMKKKKIVNYIQLHLSK